MSLYVNPIKLAPRTKILNTATYVNYEDIP
jgi:hypothetical protein